MVKRICKQSLFIFPFKPIGKLELLKAFNLRIDNLEDLITNKIFAVYERSEPKDVYDIYCALKKKKFTLEKLLKNVKKKFDVEIDETDLAAKILRGAEKLEKIQLLLFKKMDFNKEIKEFFKKKTFRYLNLFI